MIKRIILLLVCFTISAKALAVGIDCHCPEHFKESEWNKMWCVINTTAIKQANCISEQSAIYMDLSPEIYSILCDDNTSINPSYYCKCNNISADLFNCTVSILGNKTRDEGKELKCKACVSPRGNLPETRTDSCKNITFGSDSSGTSCSGSMLLSAFCLLLVFIGTYYF